MRIGVVVAIGLLSSVALGDVKEDLDLDLTSLAAGREVAPPPRFAFSDNDVYVAPKTLAHAQPALGGIDAWSEKVVAAVSADKKSAWVTANLGPIHMGCGMDPCPPPPPRVPTHHATALLDKTATGWQWVAWHIAPVVDGKEQAKALKAGVLPAAIARSVTGAEDVVKQFEATIGDPKRFVASISDRQDVVLFGSELTERVVGGAAVRAKLTSWKLAFKVRDGIAAGPTASRTAAFVAANVDAVSQARPKDKPMPYRMLLIYEKTGAAWQIVAVHFSVVT
jgi:hypothetical protein